MELSHPFIILLISVVLFGGSLVECRRGGGGGRFSGGHSSHSSHYSHSGGSYHGIPHNNPHPAHINNDVHYSGPHVDINNNQVHTRSTFGELATQSNRYYAHGSYYNSPNKHYYSNYHHDGIDESTLGFYLGYAMAKIGTPNVRYNARHYYHNKLRVRPIEFIYSDTIVDCNVKSTYLCPEYTERLCLHNQTILCVAKMNTTVPCNDVPTLSCVNTLVPCVKNKSFSMCNNNYMEEVRMPCLSTIIVVDVHADRNGWTLAAVSGTFVLVHAKSERDLTFCVTIIVDPVSNRNSSNSNI